MNFSEYENIRFERNGRVLTVVLDRAEKLNAVSRSMHRELARVFHDVAADPDSDFVVLTGAGRAFCAGGDLEFAEESVSDPLSFQEVLREARTIIHSLLDCDKPIICRMNGDAVGLGATLALFCDLIIAADHARLADPHVRVGLVAGDGGALIWPQLIGYAKAKQYLLTGEFISAPEAQSLGLINFAVPESELDATVATWLGKLARGTIQSVRWTKATVNTSLKQIASTIMDTGIAYEGMSAATADHLEAVKAMREKRKPEFKGK